ncbi:MAG: hypothetical protein H6Q35_2303 [Proteobacteria bacterium]|nr:hypothetical protein [Pseudomonadota bacterium]
MSNYTSAGTVSLVSQSSDSNTNTLVSGVKWGGAQGTGTSLSFSFPWTTNSTALWSSDYTATSEPYAAGHYGLNASQMVAAENALQSWADVANLTFTEVAESGTEVGDIRFAFSSDVADAGAWGWSYFPTNTSSLGGDIWISTSLTGINMDFSQGGYGLMSLIHELGHALGLKHPGDYYNGAEAGPYLPTATDNQLYSIMSYNSLSHDWWYDTQESKFYYNVYAETPMVYDIAAMQYLYGENTTTNTEDNVYSYDDRAPFRLSIWDAGGHDTISVANSTHSSLIDLNGGNFSSIQTSRFYNYYGISSTLDGTYNLGIAEGAIIEDAIGGNANDTLIGNEVNNNLRGNAGNDTINAGAGSDTLVGGVGNDTMLGGAGDDLYYVDSINDTIYETTTTSNAIDAGGSDFIFSTVSWTLGNYFENLRLNGSGAINGIGNSLNNTIYSANGNNVLNGEAGTDSLSYIYATTGITMNLGLTTAQVTGGSGTDTVLNFENLFGSNYNDILSGNSANNIINGNIGDDTISGGAGNDSINGGTGNDTINGGAGNDTLNGSLGTDTLSYYDATAGISINLGLTTQATGGSGTDTIFNFDNILGSNYNDVLTGSTANNVIYGYNGNDTIYAGTGNDTMLGGAGNDTYFVDSVNDLVYETTTTASSIDAGGSDFVFSTVSWTLGNYFENLRLFSSSAINGTGNALNNTIYAGDGNNILNGSAGTDTLSYYYSTAGVTVNIGITTAQSTSGSGTDTVLNFENLFGSNYNDVLTGNTSNNSIYGYTGNDIINGELGNDTMLGGAGNDTYFIDSVNDLVYETTTTANSTDAGGSDSVISTVSWTLGNYFENLRLNGSSAINGTGNALNNTIYSGDGNNVLNGGAGADTLSYYYSVAGVTVNIGISTAQSTGGSGTDTVLNFENMLGSNYNDILTGNASNNSIYGYAGNDSIITGAGNDTLVGGEGNDVLTGGVGNDIFFLNSTLNVSTNLDTITDFTASDDTIWLENGIFTALSTTGTLSSDYFITSNTALDNNDYVLYDQTSGALYYDADGNGATEAIQIALLGVDTHPTITYADFTVA